ncbi:PAS domain S-box protein [Chloroflexota bacterium]
MMEQNKKSVGTLAGNVPGVLYRCANDKYWTMEYISSEIEKITGYPASDFIGNRIRSYSSIIHHEDLDMVWEIVQKGVENKNQYIIEYRLVDRDDNIEWVYEIGTPVFDKDGELEWLEGLIIDISKLKKREEELREIKEYLEGQVAQRTSDLEKEAKRSRQLHHVGAKRMKELECLYSISELLHEPGITLEELYQKVVLILPPAWQYPEITYAMIVMNGKKYSTKNYRDTEWKLISNIETHGNKTGIVMVGYLESRENINEGPFLKEERMLIDAIAERLGKTTDRISTRDSLDLTRFTINHTDDMIVWTDKEAKILDANDVICKKLGYSKEELISMNVKDIDRNFDEKEWQSNWATLRESKHYVFNTVHITKTGDERPVEVTRNYLSFNGKEYNCAFAHDITERLRLEKELRESRQRITTLEQSVRKEIAQELHGTVQSRLIVLMHRLTELKNIVSENEAFAQIDSIQQVLSSVIDDHLRPMSRRLYPSILQRGVSVALQSLADQYEQLITVELNIDENLISQERKDKSTIREELGLALYRITEEALNNVVKHAEATEIIIRLNWLENKSIIVKIRDNGKGFNLADTRIGLGTNLMQDYSKLLGGDCTIQSTRGEGTTVTVSIPLYSI